MNRISRIFSGLVIGLSLTLSDVGVAAEARTVLKFGIVPQQSASELAKAWMPFLHFLAEKTGYELHFATAKDIPTFEQRLAAGEYDIAYMNPYHYVVFHSSPGYRVLTKESERMLKGIVVVRKNDVIPDISVLAGEVVAFPGPAAFAATILVQGELDRLGISVAPKYVASHDSVYLAVARGFTVAGGGIPRTLENMPPEVRDQLRILWSTSAYTPHAIAVHPRLSAAVAAQLQQAMTTMAADPRGAELLKAIGFKGLTLAQDKDYDDVRRLNIRLLEPLISR